MAVGSIVIRNNLVTEPESFLLNLAPADARGYADARFLNYSPTDRAEGNLWGCSFDIDSRETIYKEMFEFGLGRHVEVFGYGLEPDFEGRIYEMVFTNPPDIFTVTLRTMENSAHMRADIDGDGDVERSATLTNEESKELYGITEGVLAGGQIPDTAVAQQIVQSQIDLRGLPKPSAQFGVAQGKQMKLEIFVKGYVETLSGRVYNQTALTGTQSMTSQIGDVITAVGEFVEKYEGDANATPMTREFDIDRRAWDIIINGVRQGDSGGNRWLFGMYPRDITGVKGRVAKMFQASPVRPPAT